MLWFRLYHELLDDRKVQSLPDLRFKQYINLMCLANQSEPRGSLPCVEDIAFRLRLDDAAAVEMMAYFIKHGFVDRDATGLETVHGWEARQKKSDNVTARVQEYRAKQAVTETADDVTAPKDETLPERFSNALEKSREEKNREEESTARIRARSSLSRFGLTDEQVSALFELFPEMSDALLAVEAAAVESYWRVEKKEPPKNRYRAALNWFKKAQAIRAEDERLDEPTRPPGRLPVQYKDYTTYDAQTGDD